MWYVGIEWAAEHHDAAVVDEAGHQVAKLRVAHSAEGLGQLTTFLRELVARPGAPDLEQLACVVETTHGLLITALVEAGYPVDPVTPKPLPAAATHSGGGED